MEKINTIEDSAICYCCGYEGLVGEFKDNSHECPKCFSDNWGQCDDDIYEGIDE